MKQPSLDQGYFDHANGPRKPVDRSKLERYGENEWIAMLGHELRNPVSAIGVGIELVKIQSLDPEQRTKTVDMMQRQVSQIVRLLDDLLDVARFGKGKLEIERKPVDLRQVGLDAVDTVRRLIEDRRHELLVTLPPAGTVCVRGDRARLIQVVVNLLANAAKYTPPGGRIELEIAGRAGGATIAVRDTGIGIAGDFMPRIFDRFAQGRSALHGADRGLGLGLTLVRDFVQLHGGKVEVSSAGENQGSEFKIELPRT